MLIPNHPHDERLSALASRETDATADATLTAHVDSCARCTELISELGVLRAALSDLPDVAPSRPLRLLPPVEDAPVPAADRLGGWARRFFAPLLASGAALALVGTIGTAAPSFSGQAGGGADGASTALQAPAATAAQSEAAAGAAAEAAPSAADLLDATERAAAAEDGGGEAAVAEESNEVAAFGDDDGASGTARLETEQSPWPVVLFTGVALMIGALLLRWTLVPRAG